MLPLHFHVDEESAESVFLSVDYVGKLDELVAGVLFACGVRGR